MPDHETPFFLSYARAKDGSRKPDVAHSADRMTERFFRDLQEDIGQLISMRTGADIGFIDTGMKGGVRWVDELLHAAGTCQVLIALLSVPYLSCEWCGREWCAFKRRVPRKLPGTGASPRQGHIIPVIWAPVPFALPSPVSDEMIFSPIGDPDPDLPARYKANGVYGLMRMGRDDSYRIIIWQLAMLVSEVYYSQRLEACEFQLEHLDNLFQGALP